MQKDSLQNKPTLDDYPQWLEKTWDGDKRELSAGRFLHQQLDLRTHFERSPFWCHVQRGLPEWAEEYNKLTGHRLFSGPAAATLDMKSWESFLNKTWRENVRNNPNWPQEPPLGWVLPDTWFERFWDILRTRFTVHYLDGVKFLVDKLELQAELDSVVPRVEAKAKDTGYYAMHIVIPQEFEVLGLDYLEPELRRSEIEIQVTTELQEMVGDLTHRHFEKDRGSLSTASRPWQWDYERPEFSPYYLGHVLHWVEGVIMNLREPHPSPDQSHD